jgi:nucleoside-diphosphate-sugar epimerase
VKHSLADITKARMLLGYCPKYTVEEGIRLTVQATKDR